MQKQPLPPIVKKVRDIASEPVDGLGGLTDHHLKYIVFAVNDFFKIKDYHIDINYKSTPKRITIRAYSESGKEVYIRSKRPNFFKDLTKFLNLPDYEIGFADKAQQ